MPASQPQAAANLAAADSDPFGLFIIEGVVGV